MGVGTESAADLCEGERYWWPPLAAGWHGAMGMLHTF